jgi:hypothetical protein
MDSAGAIFEIDGQRQFHPVATAQSGLAALARGNVRDAEIAANALIENSTFVDGARMYPYGFAYVYDNQPLTPPWYSAMAEGQALSLLVRLVGLADREDLRAFADETYLGLNRLTVHQGDRSWADEYPIHPTNVVLNGAIWATFGRWDYWLVTGSGREELCSAVESLRAALQEDARQSLYYDLRRHFYIPRGDIYRAIQLGQMDVLYEMTSDSAFLAARALLVSDPP